jgi:hypothetical protein
VKYASEAPALSEAVRAAFRSKALSGVRQSAEGDLAVFRFYLGNDALREATAG